MILNNGNKGIQYQCKEHLFLAGLWHYDGAFTCCCEIQGGMQQENRLQLAKSVQDLKQRMAQDSVYEDRHFRKVDKAYEHFEERCKLVGLRMPASTNDVP